MNRYPLSNQSQYQYSSGDAQSPRRRPPSRPPQLLPPLFLPFPPFDRGGRGKAALEAHPAPPHCFLSRRCGTVADTTVDGQHPLLELSLSLLLLLCLLCLLRLRERHLLLRGKGELQKNGEGGGIRARPGAAPGAAAPRANLPSLAPSGRQGASPVEAPSVVVTRCSSTSLTLAFSGRCALWCRHSASSIATVSRSCFSHERSRRSRRLAAAPARSLMATARDKGNEGHTLLLWLPLTCVL